MPRRDSRPKAPTFERWEDYFDPDERLIWEGAPVPGFYFNPALIFLSLFGLPFLGAGLSVFLMGLGSVLGISTAASGFGAVFMIVFSLPFIAVGGGFVLGPVLAGPVSSRRTRYALTDRRAYVAKSYFRRSMETYTIAMDDPIEIQRGRNVDTVYFNVRHGRTSKGRKTIKKIGFENIPDGEAVYKLLRRMQDDPDR